MHRFVIAASLIVALALGVFAASPASAQDVLNCGDIATQNDAQRILEADLSDPNRLDGNNDGVACESGVGGGTVTFDSYFGVTPPVVDVPVDTAPVVDTPVDTAPAVDVPADTTVSTGAATTTTTSTGATTLPSTGSGTTSTTPVGLTTLLLALFAGAAFAIGTTGLIRSRRA